MLPYYMFCTEAEEARYDESEGKMLWTEPYDDGDEECSEYLSLQQTIEVVRYNNMRLILEFKGHELELVDYTEFRRY